METVKHDYVAAVAEHGSERAAARALGLARTTFRERLEKQKYRAAVEPALVREAVGGQRRTLADYADEVLAAHREVPEWTSQHGAPSRHTLIGTVLSDIHFEEVIDPAQVFGLNEYNPTVAALRLRRYFEGVPRIAREVLSGLNHQGVVLFLGGDNLSGLIHDELSETNSMTSPQALLRLSEHLSAGIRMLADEFGSVHVVGVPGNHPRMHKKPRAKGAATHNLDWLLYGIVARDFTTDVRVSFRIGVGVDMLVPMFGWKVLLTHGDQARGGSGAVTGMYGPLLSLWHKRVRWAAQTGNTFDYMAVGHWHFYAPIGPIVANGSVVGFNEYAQAKALGYQAPQQALWVMHPQRGMGYQTPVFLEPPRVPREDMVS